MSYPDWMETLAREANLRAQAERAMNPSTCDRRQLAAEPEAFWRDSRTGRPLGLDPALLGTEAANDIPPEASRTFRPRHLARRVSFWRAMLDGLRRLAISVAGH